MNPYLLTLGAIPIGDSRCSFRVWSPHSEKVELHLLGKGERLLPMQRDERGYHSVIAEKVAPDCEYQFLLDGKNERPDPASRWQAKGVHGPSRVTDSAFEWNDEGWFGLPLREYIIYELHVGTFSADGTFDGVIQHLAELKNLGVTAIELMPVAQFPGSRNWGYDGVFPFAVQNSYGGPAGLKRLVNAAHQHGLAVVLDVVYNHLGPEGNYLRDFGPYFTKRYATPWGDALNFDGADSDEVRRFFIENAFYWQTEFHMDALRLDAVHAIRDFSPFPFLQELAEVTHRQADVLNRRFHLIAESDMNMARHILPENLGGYGLDAQWSDDFHHSLRVLVTGEKSGYYTDFDGGVKQFAKVWREGYAYTGEYSPFRRHRHGTSPRLNHAKQFVVYRQNHDQIGNRMLGDRLNHLTDFESLKLSAAAVLLSPFVPMLFMGEEYAESAPFLYFVSHTDPQLVEAVRKGRREEFAAFKWQGEVPDPQAEATFEKSKLNRAMLEKAEHHALREFYRELVRLRKTVPAIAFVEKETMEVREFERENVLFVRYWRGADEVVLLFNFSEAVAELELPFAPGQWRKRLDSTSPHWNGSGSDLPEGFVSEDFFKLRFPMRSAVVFGKTLVLS